MNWRERALAVTPGGAQTRSKRSTAFPVGYPQFLTRSHGAYVWDADDNRYIDWICALGAISLGYGHFGVLNAVRDQLVRGISFSLATTLEVEVAELLHATLPGADMVRFCKTGSEATEGAMRIARVAKCRNRIISIGYHGWHTMHDAAATDHWGHAAATPGVPPVLKEYVIAHPWGTPLPESPKGYEVAGVVVEVMRDDPPPEGWLQGIQDWCSGYGAALIFDEMVTGFRWAIGGAAEFFNITPDLACYGKGMANGFPLAAIVGSADLMQHASYVSGTFGGEAVSLAACRATINAYRYEKVIEHMWQTGTTLMNEFNSMASATGLSMTGYPVHPRVVGEQRDAFIGALARAGVLWHPSGFNISLAHGQRELDETLSACQRVLRGMS